MISLIKKFTAAIIVFHFVPSWASDIPFSNLIKKYGVVYLGEMHTAKNHKELTNSFLDVMAHDPQVDTFAFEHGYQINQAALEQYRKDKTAGEGSLKELFYICKISSEGSGRNLTFEDFKRMGIKKAKDLIPEGKFNSVCGSYSWQRYNFYPSSLSMFRKIRQISLENPSRNFRFCPLDYSIEEVEDFEGFKLHLKTLKPDLAVLFEKKYGRSTNRAGYRADNGEVLDNALRDFKMAEHARDCFRGRQGGLILAGAYHSQDSSHSAEPQTTLVGVLRSLNSLNMGFDFKGANLFIFNADTYLKRMCKGECKNHSEVFPLIEILNLHPEYKTEFMMIKTNQIPKPVIESLAYATQALLAPLPVTYDYLLIAPETKDCSEESCE